MTPGEVKGLGRQILITKNLSEEEKQAMKHLLEAYDLMLVASPHISKFLKEIQNAKRGTSSSDSSPECSTDKETDPNTGW